MNLKTRNAVKAETVTHTDQDATFARETQESQKTSTPVDPRDHAHRVLLDAPLDTEQKADAWDAFYRAPNADNLARSLEGSEIPAHISAALVTAKKLADSEKPAPSRADRLKAAATQMSQLDPQTLAIAEKHPNVLKFLLGGGAAPKE